MKICSFPLKFQRFAFFLSSVSVSTFLLVLILKFVLFFSYATSRSVLESIIIIIALIKILKYLVWEEVVPSCLKILSSSLKTKMFSYPHYTSVFIFLLGMLVLVGFGVYYHLWFGWFVERKREKRQFPFLFCSTLIPLKFRFVLFISSPILILIFPTFSLRVIYFYCYYPYKFTICNLLLSHYPYLQKGGLLWQQLGPNQKRRRTTNQLIYKTKVIVIYSTLSSFIFILLFNSMK